MSNDFTKVKKLVKINNVHLDLCEIFIGGNYERISNAPEVGSIFASIPQKRYL
jgi:hypothetical protein